MCPDIILIETEFQLIKQWQFEDYVKTVRSKETEIQDLVLNSNL